MFASPWELIAVVCGLVFLVLAIRENPWCWLFGAVSTAIFFVLFWRSSLYMQSLLQVYYVGVSFYGWWNWRRGGDAGSRLPVLSWPPARHAAITAIIILTGLLSGFFLDRRTDAELPYLDALTTCGGLVSTWMAARKVLQNWLYWLVIDAAAVVMYLISGLQLTAGLYAVYFMLAITGYVQWRRSYLETRG